MAAPLKWYDANATDNPPFLKALAEVRKIGVHEGWCYHHVQAIIVAIDQMPSLAWQSRILPNRPRCIGSSRKVTSPDEHRSCPSHL
jgi:hypothetical protein